MIEVNHTPSFTTDTPLDFKIKKGLELLLSIEDKMPHNLELKVKIAKGYFKATKLGLRKDMDKSKAMIK